MCVYVCVCVCVCVFVCKEREEERMREREREVIKLFRNKQTFYFNVQLHTLFACLSIYLSMSS